ncbi:VACUOLAR PROTEIN SORTING-ASSOCIATED PROTEIN-RELATED [Salix purpurea]|uniref:VACUOLAR PROTEIN SORTING-ASSOCIATED PROTEIN-RELATED n=1 Tax=Salix purpurea TaxID=77065 RepID=A0A9Q0WEH7_SALPP|nr:VACUOLAR PROTEIN SORTING-ASSOCIATED PROTEIN-RELATED [Salix purpurea]
MQPHLFPFGSVFGNPFLLNADLGEDGVGFGFERSRLFFLVPFLLLQGVGGGGSSGGMDLSKVGERILSSVRSARSLGLLPHTIDRPEVPARAAAAAAVARVLAGMPPYQRFNLPSSSEELRSIYGSIPQGHMVEELEEDFYEEDFDPVRHILEHVPSEENELTYFEEQATLRLAQLDRVAERLSHHVMEHHEVMVKGMNLVREVEKDLKVANVICMNGRRHLTSSMNEVSRDLVVNTNSKRKQTLLGMLAVLTELHRTLEMQVALESLVEEGSYCKAFQVLSEYLQLLDSFSELSAIQEMSRGVEVWLGRTLQKLDALLLGVCQEFKEESYITVVDAYALIGDISGLAEKLQSFYMQEVLSETHSVLKDTVQEDLEIQMQNSRLTYSDLCLQIPESKFRQCLLRTLAVLFRLISSYHEIMSFQLENKGSAYQTSDMKQDSLGSNESSCESVDRMLGSSPTVESTTTSMYLDSNFNADETRSNGSEASSSESPWYHLRKDATAFVSQTLQRGRKILWQLTTSRVSVLLSSAVISSMSTHQFLKNYEDLNVFILAGEAFCGIEAVEFRQKLKAVCENYFLAFHRQNIHALKMVLEKENWLKLPPDTVQAISFAGLVGNGAALIVPSHGSSSKAKLHHSTKPVNSIDATIKKSGFTSWIKSGNPFLPKLISTSVEGQSSLLNGVTAGEYDGHANDSYHGDQASPHSSGASHKNGTPVSEDENEDLLADFIDEDSQLPSRISRPKVPKSNFSYCKDDEISSQTGSSLCLLRSMDKYARFMQKLEIVNVEFFKGICQLFEIFFYFVFETFGQQNSNSNGKSDSLNYRLKTAISRITQDCDQWIKPQLTPVSSSSPTSLSTYMHGDVTPASPPNHSLATSFGLKERCAAADTISLVAQILHRSKTHLQSMLLQNNPAIVEDFFVLLVDSVPDVIEHLHRTTARSLLHINGYVDRIANAKWEVKELGLEHNGYVDLLLGEFKHYKTRLAHGGIHKEVQDRLLEYGVEIVAETLIEGLSRVKRCGDEGRALMSLDLQVLINGLQHFVPVNVKPKLQMVETFIKAYYLPETEYVHWARAHPEYTKTQVVGLINLVAAMKGWKRKTRLEVIEKIE